MPGLKASVDIRLGTIVLPVWTVPRLAVVPLSMVAPGGVLLGGRHLVTT